MTSESPGLVIERHTTWPSCAFRHPFLRISLSPKSGGGAQRMAGFGPPDKPGPSRQKALVAAIPAQIRGLRGRIFEGDLPQDLGPVLSTPVFDLPQRPAGVGAQHARRVQLRRSILGVATHVASEARRIAALRQRLQQAMLCRILSRHHCPTRLHMVSAGASTRARSEPCSPSEEGASLHCVGIALGVAAAVRNVPGSAAGTKELCRVHLARRHSSPPYQPD